MRFSHLPKSILRSLYSKDLYIDVCKNWPGTGALYLLTLICLCMIPISMKLSGIVKSSFIYQSEIEGENNKPSQELLEIINQVPEMHVENGKLYLDAPQPYNIIPPYQETPLIIIDTTGKRTSLRDTNAAILITERSVIFQKNSQEIQRMSISEIVQMFNLPVSQRIDINKDIAAEWLQEIIESLNTVTAVFYVWQVTAFFIFFGIRSIMISAIGIFFCQILKFNLPFKTLVRLSIMASTPVILIETISTLIGHEIFQNKQLVYFVLHSLYLYFAIEWNKKSKENQA